MNILRCGGEIRETKTRNSYIAALPEGSDDIFSLGEDIIEIYVT